MALQATSLGPKPSYFVLFFGFLGGKGGCFCFFFFFEFFFFPFLLRERNLLFPLKKVHFCLLVSVSLCFSQLFVSLPFCFLCFSVSLVFLFCLSSFLVFFLFCFILLPCVGLFVSLSCFLAFVSLTKHHQNIITYSFFSINSDFRAFGPRPDGLACPGSRLRESLRVFLASFGGPARSDQGVSEAVSEPAMAVSSRFEGVPERFSCLFSGTCRIRSGSQRGLSRRPRFSFQGVLDDLPASFGCPGRSDHGVGEAVMAVLFPFRGSP